jgi:NAD(P)-dependent dehydrogenase (short-subunit alcohol dehydrogenase family)
LFGMTTTSKDLNDRIAVAAGGTRGAGRGIAVELGAAGATVYVTGRTTTAERSPMGRSETIQDTARLVDEAGGTGIPVRIDHTWIVMTSLIPTMREFGHVHWKVTGAELPLNWADGLERLTA